MFSQAGRSPEPIDFSIKSQRTKDDGKGDWVYKNSECAPPSIAAFLRSLIPVNNEHELLAATIKFFQAVEHIHQIFETESLDRIVKDLALTRSTDRTIQNFHQQRQISQPTVPSRHYPSTSGNPSSEPGATFLEQAPCSPIDQQLPSTSSAPPRTEALAIVAAVKNLESRKRKAAELSGSPDQLHLQRFRITLLEIRNGTLQKTITELKKGYDPQTFAELTKRLETVERDHKVLLADTRCPICYDARADHVVRPCGHSFCLGCLDSLKTKTKGQMMCPICRSNLKGWLKVKSVGVSPDFI